MLMGHHDYDGGRIPASGDRELTRRLVHGYSDFTATWQDVSEGQMGRLLPGLMISDRFADTATDTILFVDLELAPDFYAQAYLEWVSTAASEFGIYQSDIARWLAELEERAARAAFYFAIPWVYVIAHVHPRK